MKSTIICLSIFVIIIFTGCRNNVYEYWDISKFNIEKNALEDEEEIKLLYTSQGPDNDMEYYIQLVVVSQKTGDTVNILTSINNGITMEDEDKIFNYFNQDNFASKLVQMKVTGNAEKIENVKDIENHELEIIHKVARDPKFDYIADNNYPTVIGTIGILSKAKEE